jgi:hypothetical protein
VPEQTVPAHPLLLEELALVLLEELALVVLDELALVLLDELPLVLLEELASLPLDELPLVLDELALVLLDVDPAPPVPDVELANSNVPRMAWQPPAAIAAHAARPAL